MKGNLTRVSLKTHVDMSFLPLAMSFAEESAKAFGLDGKGVLKLTLACEEVFSHLCGIGKPGRVVTIEALNGIYYVQIKFVFDATHFDPYAFNLTARVSCEDTAGMAEMGLLIASRSVERLHILHDPREGLGLLLVKEKSYPDAAATTLLRPKPLAHPSFHIPDPDILKLFVHQVISCYGPLMYPSDFAYPGKVVDMVASGEYGCLVVTGDQGEPGGGIIWRYVGAKTIEVFGPYVFLEPPAPTLAEGLMDHFLSRIAKTDALCLINRYATAEMPKGYFELLGTVETRKTDGTSEPWPFYYRQMKEDPGCQVWTHPDLEPFLRREYRRLFLARELLLSRYEGEVRPPHSVFATHFTRAQDLVTMHPIWDGKDTLQNLEEHLSVLKGEHLSNIFFEIDLALAWQANLTPCLLHHGFEPRLILPYAGQGDLVLFQHKGVM